MPFFVCFFSERGEIEVMSSIHDNIERGDFKPQICLSQQSIKFVTTFFTVNQIDIKMSFNPKPTWNRPAVTMHPVSYRTDFCFDRKAR